MDGAGLHVTSLINNAGFGTFGAFVDEDAQQLDREIAVDISTPVKLSAEFLPDILAAGNGFLINVASMAAYMPSPEWRSTGGGEGVHLSFTESLWAELRGTGVIVFALSPGATSTEFNSVVGTDDATAGARMRERRPMLPRPRSLISISAILGRALSMVWQSFRRRGLGLVSRRADREPDGSAHRPGAPSSYCMTD